MDPIVISTLLRPEMHFLVRGESFTNKIMVRIYNKLNMIPIYRRAYSPDEVHKNDDVFEHCFALLESGGALMIFPEGLCQTKFLLAPLKTGTARIALGVEQKNKYALDLQLVPIGINYTNPHAFRGGLVLDIGEPIAVKDYQVEYESDPEPTVKKLTADIQDQLSNLIITLKQTDDDELIRRTELLFENTEEIEGELGSKKWYDKRKIIAGGINFFRENNSEELAKFESRLNTYFLRAKLIDPKSISPHDVLARLNIKSGILQWLLLIVGFPIFLFGVICHIIPFMLTRILAHAIVKRMDFTGSVFLALGLLVFTIFGLSEARLVYVLSESYFIAVVFLMIWPTLGLFSYSYYFSAGSNISRLRTWINGRNRKRLKAYLMDEKRALLNILSNAYAEFNSKKE